MFVILSDENDKDMKLLQLRKKIIASINNDYSISKHKHSFMEDLTKTHKVLSNRKKGLITLFFFDLYLSSFIC